MLDLAGREVTDGQEGELVVRGPYTIRGYYNAPDINAKAFTPEGFYRMGDIVRKHGRYLVTEGRKNDLINRGGEKIAPLEIDAVLLTHPAVSEAVCFGIAHATWGEEVAAAIPMVAAHRTGRRTARQRTAISSSRHRSSPVKGFARPRAIYSTRFPPPPTKRSGHR